MWWEFQVKLCEARKQEAKVDRLQFSFDDKGMKHNFLKLVFSFLIISSLSALQAQAYDEEYILPPPLPSKFPEPFVLDLNTVLNSTENYRRTLLVLDHYKVLPEADPSNELQDLQQLQTMNQARKVLSFLDPLNIFDKIASMDTQDVKFYQDIQSKMIMDFQLKLKADSSISDIELDNKNTRLPLAGLRIALDPGHMGGTFWDKKTGKYVQDSKGRIVSEGVIALQTALLLKKEFQSLGAQVLVTHETLGAVSDQDVNTFDITPYAQAELRDNIHAPWFIKLIQSAKNDKELLQLFDNSAERKKLFSESNRDFYFIRRTDLWARVNKINQWNPDLVLIIHFDTDDSGDHNGGVNPKAPNATKAYVVGGYQVNELGSRSARQYFARHLLDQRSWDQSVRMSQSILKNFTTQMGLKLASSGGESAYAVAPGVFARNLVIPRMLKAPVMSYLECLFYNNPAEFERFYNTKYPLDIGGKNYPYSDRLLQVVNSIRDGVLQFYQAQ